MLASGTSFGQTKKDRSLESEKTRLLLIVDCSNSMWDHWQSDSKIKVTQQVLLKFLDMVTSQDDTEVALRVFGHLNRYQIGTRLEVPFESDNLYQLQSKIKTLVPQGGCTASTALTDALHDFPQTDSSRNIILIITDGMDDCDAAICQVARQVQLSGVVVQTFILGIGDKKNFKHSLDCAGKFSIVDHEEDYLKKLYDIYFCSDMAPVVIQVKNTIGQIYEDEIPVAFYDPTTGVAKYSTLYAANSSAESDTILIDPLINYDVTFFTNPDTTLHNCSFVPKKTNRLVLTADMGALRVRRNDTRVTWHVPDYPVIVRRHGSSEILAVQKLGEEVSYLQGSYDLEVLASPTMKFEGIEVQESASTDISIPMPGMLNLTKPKQISTGSVFAIREGRMEWVCDLNSNSIIERIVLMPGEYLLLIHPQGSIEHKKVKQRRFMIESSKQTNIAID